MPETAPAFSVIIPMYNCAAYIEECLGSLKAQTRDDFEALCVDDASTDATVQKAKNCIGEDARFTVFEMTENAGQGKARNVALSHARGTYIVLLDADDYLVPTALEKMGERAFSQDLDELYFAAKSLYESADVALLVQEDLDIREPMDDVLTGQELFTHFEHRNEFFAHAALRMIRRALIEENKIRFNEHIIHEDALFTFQTLVLARRSSFLSEVLYIRRIRGGSTMTTRLLDVRTVEGHYVCFCEMRTWMQQHAEELDPEFIVAMTHRIAEYAQIAGYDWCIIDNTEAKERFLQGLSKAELIDFYTEIVYRGESIKHTEDVYLRSRTFRLGNGLLRIPKYLRNRLRGSGGTAR